MNQRRFGFAIVVMIALGTFSTTRCQAAELVAKPKLDELILPVVNGGWSYGLAVGLVNGRGMQTVGYGRISTYDPRSPRPDTVFEIGSITKVFTGLLLAEMAIDHQVSLDEPVQKLLGDSITIPK